MNPDSRNQVYGRVVAGVAFPRMIDDMQLLPQRDDATISYDGNGKTATVIFYEQLTEEVVTSGGYEIVKESFFHSMDSMLEFAPQTGWTSLKQIKYRGWFAPGTSVCFQSGTLSGVRLGKPTDTYLFLTSHNDKLCKVRFSMTADPASERIAYSLAILLADLLEKYGRQAPAAGIEFMARIEIIMSYIRGQFSLEQLRAIRPCIVFEDGAISDLSRRLAARELAMEEAESMATAIIVRCYEEEVRLLEQTGA